MRQTVIVLAVLFLLTGCSAGQDDSQQAASQEPPSDPTSPERRYINMPDRTDNNPYSNAVLVGDTLYLAGDIGIDPETGAPPEDISEEVRLVVNSMKTRLEMVGMTMDDLVTVQVFCPDLSLYDQFNEVYRTYFNQNFPARAFIGSGPLLAGGHFEVMGTAIRGSN